MCINPKTILVNGEEVKVKCGKCLRCKQQRASEWTIKLINEGKYYKKKCFITLTFDNKKLIDTNSKSYKYGANASFLWNIEYSKKYVTKFIKRLREKIKPIKIKYFKVGEYGDKNHRPHYHLIIFGYNFDKDRVKAEVSKSGKEQFFSEELEELWACGRTRIQDLNNKNIAYISQYSVKKMKIKDEETFKKNYIPEIINIETGAIKWKYKYKTSMSYSNRAKMNAKWIRKRPEQIQKGYLTDQDGHKYKIPRSYIEALKKSDWLIHQKYFQMYDELINEQIFKDEKSYSEKQMTEFAKEKILESKLKKNLRADF